MTLTNGSVGRGTREGNEEKERIPSVHRAAIQTQAESSR